MTGCGTLRFGSKAYIGPRSTSKPSMFAIVAKPETSAPGPGRAGMAEGVSG